MDMRFHKSSEKKPEAKEAKYRFSFGRKDQFPCAPRIFILPDPLRRRKDSRKALER
jgi:hypothetical protein